MNESKSMHAESEAGIAAVADYRAEIAGVIRSNLTPGRMRERILSYHENDAAEALEMLTREERGKLYNILDTASLAGILEYADRPLDYIRELGVRKRVEVLSQLDASVAADILRQMEKPERDTVLELMEPDAKGRVLLISSFDEDEIGSRMSENYIRIAAGSTIKEAMSSLIGQAAENDNISTLYVVDGNGVFSGAVNLKDLIIAREGDSLESITSCSHPYVYASAPLEECVRTLRDYSEDSVPVLGSDNRLLGVITAQDLTDAVENELGEDYAKLAGLSSGEDLAEPVGKSVRKRLPWLMILLGLGMLVSSVVGIFEAVVAQLTIVIFFQSLILDMAGNVGTQSLAVTIRVLMDEEVSRRQKWKLIWKEARIGFLNGLILGTLAFVLVGAYLWLLKGNAPFFSFAVSGCVSAALLMSMIVSSIFGTGIPMFFRKIHVDPAVASGPLITTINDLVAVVSYYGLAWLLLIRLMHF